MPQPVENFVPWRVLEYVQTRLATELGKFGGYNNQPLVTLDFDAYQNSTVDCSIFIDCPDLRMTEHEIGDGTTGATRVTPEIVLNLYGSVRTKADQPQRVLMSLVQDVLTLLSSKPNDLRTVTGRGMTMRVNNVLMGTFTLTGQKESTFNLEVVFRYLQGSEW